MSLGYPSRAARVAAFAFVALLVSAPAFAACGAAPTAAPSDSLLRLRNAEAGWLHAVVDSGSAVEGDFVYDGTNKVVAFCNGTSWVDVATGGGSSTLNGIMAATANQAGIANAAYTIVWNWDTLAGGSAYFTVHNITWRALPAEFGSWNSIWKRFWRGFRHAKAGPLGSTRHAASNPVTRNAERPVPDARRNVAGRSEG